MWPGLAGVMHSSVWIPSSATFLSLLRSSRETNRIVVRENESNWKNVCDTVVSVQTSSSARKPSTCSLLASRTAPDCLLMNPARDNEQNRGAMTRKTAICQAHAVSLTRIPSDEFRFLVLRSRCYLPCGRSKHHSPVSSLNRQISMSKTGLTVTGIRVAHSGFSFGFDAQRHPIDSATSWAIDKSLFPFSPNPYHSSGMAHLICKKTQKIFSPCALSCWHRITHKLNIPNKSKKVTFQTQFFSKISV